MGPVPGAIFQHAYQTLQWSNYLDGVMIFRTEYPLTSTMGK